MGATSRFQKTETLWYRLNNGWSIERTLTTPMAASMISPDTNWTLICGLLAFIAFLLIVRSINRPRYD